MKITTLAEGKLARCVAEPGIYVSDLHMGAGDRADNFRANRELFSALVNHYPHHRLVLGGDGFDGWECRTVWNILCKYGGLLLGLARRILATVIVAGNHDGDAPFWAALTSALPRGFIFEDRAYTTLYVAVEHGHRLDPACSGPGTWVGRSASAVWGWIERKGWGRRLEWLHRWAVRRNTRQIQTAARRGDDNGVYFQEFSERTDVPVVYVTGHTHRPELRQHPRLPGRWYANTGSWVEPGRGYAVIIEGAKIALVEITE